MILFVLLWICGVWSIDALSKDYRLPSTIKPEHYDLEIFTNLSEDNFSFLGKVTIRVNCITSTNQIVLHSKNLTIHSSKIVLQDLTERRSIKPTSFDFDFEKDFFIITAEENFLDNNKYSIFIPFEGKLDDNLYGYYRSSYFDSISNKTEWMAVTQFEATSARKAFPCFDEPAMKAIFKLSLIRHRDYTSISNMPLMKAEPLSSNSDWVIDRYPDTLPMSTYLLAFIVSKFEYKQSSLMLNNVLFKVFARRDAILNVNFAAEVGPKALRYFEEYFNVSYVLPKQDMIAIPDFSAGAMENWGLITYREALLLFDNMTNTEVSKSSIVNIICHELAHQWFGNLVTMKWWTDLWLNEGFATQMAAIATNALFPEWGSLDHDTASNALSVFSLDSLKSSHPISVPVQNPKEISEIFDIISYKKGSFLLHMIIQFLGEKTFKNGLTRYLNKHKFDNAEQDDLWKALTIQAHEDGTLKSHLTVKEIMDTWTIQTGYPVLTVIRNYACNTAVLMQEKFLYNRLMVKSTEKTCWWIPVTYITEDNLKLNSTRPKLWLSCPCGIDLVTNMPGNDKWILFNVNISALYRINYDELNWKLLTNTLQSKYYQDIPILNRVQLVDDSASLAWTGDLSYDIHFNILNYLVKEKSYLPWRAALNNLDTLDKLLRRTSLYGMLKPFVRKLLFPIYNQIGGFQTRKSLNVLEESKFQSMITIWSCNYQIVGCVIEAQDLFKQWQANPSVNVIPKDLRPINYCVVLKNGGETEWNFLWNQYQKAKLPADKQVILNSLACTKDIWLLIRYLEMSISKNSGLRKQDVGTVLNTVANNEVGYYVIKTFLFQKLPEIYKYLGSSSKIISRVFMTLAVQIVEDSDLQEFKRFTTTNQQFLKDSAQSIRQAIETAEIQVEWYKRNNEVITNVLQKLQKSGV